MTLQETVMCLGCEVTGICSEFYIKKTMGGVDLGVKIINIILDSQRIKLKL